MSDVIKALPGMVRAHKTAYGVNHVGKPQYSEGSWERIDVWVSDTDTGLVDAGKSFRERRAAAGPNDVSDMASKIYAGCQTRWAPGELSVIRFEVGAAPAGYKR